MTTDAERGAAAVSPTFDIDADGIAWITFDDPGRSLNVLTEAVMIRLGQAFDQARAAGREGRARVVVLRSGNDGGFIAGADVDAIAGLDNPVEAEQKVRMGQQIFQEAASLPIPTVAAIHGICLGGGLELALACGWRIASDDARTRLGLPEVMLGILPAWGGTTRLPRLVGLQAALDLLLTGKQIDARKAQRIGLVDRVVPADLFRDQVRRFALAVADGAANHGEPRRKVLQKVLDETGPGRAMVLRTAHKKVMGSTGGHYPAPLRILDLLGEHLTGSVEASLQAEARAAGALIVSPECKSLIHVFRMREGAKKLDPGSREGAGGARPDARPGARPVSRIGVLGAGVMGGGIAQLAAHHGIDAYMKDIRHEAVASGLRHARGLFDAAVERRRMTRSGAARAMDRVAGGLDMRGVTTADLVVEAVVERMDVKRQVLAEAERYVSERCVLATNTSSLSVAEMAGALERPERFCGMHFFNPVHRMPLVEIVRGPDTDDVTVATVHRLAVRLGKVPVVVGDGPGFLVNRILGPYLNEGGYLLADGYPVEVVDAVAKRFGMPMGPLRLIDEVGMDVARHAGEALHRALGPRLEPSPVLARLGGAERLGRKSGLGFYRYEDGAEDGVDPEVYAHFGLPAPAGNGERRPTEDEEATVRARLVLPMINEAARILDDGIARSAADVDLAMIMGTGFPPFRGGLLRFADQLHPKAVVDRLRGLAAAHGTRFAPAPLLERLAADDRTFYDAFPPPTTEVARRA